jgi:hypothetical protein
MAKKAAFSSNKIAQILDGRSRHFALCQLNHILIGPDRGLILREQSGARQLRQVAG